MVSVKVLKPYYLKVDPDQIRVVLAYQYFTIEVNEKVYQFVPKKDKEILIDRQTQKILNTDAVLAFQKGLDIKYIPMVELISVPDFLIQLYAVTRLYYKEEPDDEVLADQAEETAFILAELENMNIRRLIDTALDNRDEGMFNDLTKQL